MKMKLLLAGVLFALTATATAQDNSKPKGSLHTLVFGDYYWMPSNHNENLEGNNGFWIRRIYFTYDRTISDSFSARFRLDMSSAGDFVTNTKLVPSVKDAYLKWHNEHHQITAGISGTPTFSMVEDVWGYRSIEKTPLDLQGMASSRDIGVSFKGDLGNASRIHYNFMFANGNSNKTELNKGKKLMLSLGYDLTDALTVEAYGDWNDLPSDQDIYTAQVFLGYQTNMLNVGALYAHQVQQNATVGQDLDLDLASVFTHFNLSEKATAVLRADHLFQPNPAGPGIDYIPFSSEAESTLLIGGLDFSMDENVHLMPNIEAVLYGETAQNKTPKADVMPRMTLSFSF